MGGAGCVKWVWDRASHAPATQAVPLPNISQDILPRLCTRQVESYIIHCGGKQRAGCMNTRSESTLAAAQVARELF